MRHDQQLECARQAALHAGARLRLAFHDLAANGEQRTGVDKAVEFEIQQRLLASFQYGYLGSGTSPTTPPRDGDHVWVVDPHDDSTSFSQGFRGAAVCIALLREGLPVLGVVYAYCAPDDKGDLFTWAEGTGPLRRNGTPVQLERSKPDTVLVTPHAGRAPQEWSRRVSPLRFRAVPSMAYRLALTAAGEARAAVSVDGPAIGCLAAAHALLMSAGLGLIDAQGQPVRHDRDGRSSSERGAGFGGEEGVIRQLAARDWTFPTDSEGRGTGVLGPCWPARGCAVADSAILSRAQGCLLGQLAGDALGGLVEFQRAEAIRAAHPGGARQLVDGGTWGTFAGQPTDDSEMALMLARSILDSGGYNAEAAARAYAAWYDSPPFDIGTTTATAVSAAAQALRDGAPAAAAARAAALEDSQANGGLMRASPLGILGAGAPVGAAGEWAVADATLTHPHPVCQHANRVYVETLAHAIRTGAGPQALYRFALDAAAQPGTPLGIGEALVEAATRPPASYSSNMGWVRIALHNAVWQLLHAPTLEEGVVSTVMAGGDTDTNAAIAGALLGAVHGRQAIPLQWLDRLLTCRPLPQSGTRHPRPEGFWPVDALWLAERLLWVGTHARH